MLSNEALEKIDIELAKYPDNRQRSAIMSALRIAQSEKGWLSHELVGYVADYLKIPPVQALEVATFYGMYNLKPVGKYKLTVCTNLPCALSGGVDAALYLKERLGVGFNETTADGMYTLKEGECMGACGDAPVILVNNHKMCSFMTTEAIEKKLAELQ
ncbi:MAG: NADH-quinone oxidoreductase subunit [Burkholderiales bacterium]|jgi:NADH-quinone oxidoreductase subunit E|nr:NADH-quinone oxidoreductase subunit [Burkholderiales bacterium]MCE3268101.1 NADH-quinone oxidoreductase subunit [Burkholderiales bacterium]